MDDVSQKRLERVEEKVITLEQGQKGLAVRFEQLHGLVQTFEAKTTVHFNLVMAAIDKASDERRELHGILMRSFQAVLEEVRVERAKEIAELRAEVTLLKAQVAELQRGRQATQLR